MITEKSTKAAIWSAYLQQQETIMRLEREAEQEASPSLSKGEEPGKVTVVIPYVKGPAQGNELLLTVRGWAKNFAENFNLVIVGDREPWMNDEVTVIECKRASDNPPVDVANKMMLAIESNLVTDKFIWSNDDQYLVSKCMLADFETLKCTGKLGEKYFGSNIYQDNKRKTFELLKKLGCSTWDYSSHTPFVFEKEKLKTLIEKYSLTTSAYLIATLYYNYWFTGWVPYNVDTQTALFNDNFKVGVYRPNADLKKLKELIPVKKVVSNSQSGWTNMFEDVMKSVLHQKSRFEK